MRMKFNQKSQFTHITHTHTRARARARESSTHLK